MNNDTIKALREVLNKLQYERVDAWIEHSDGLFEYRGFPEYGLEAAYSELTTIITQLEQAEGVDLEKGAKAMWQQTLTLALANGKYLPDEVPTWETLSQQARNVWINHARFCATAWGLKVKE